LFSSVGFFSFVVEATGSSFFISSVLIFSSVIIDTVFDVVGNSIVVIDSVVSSIKIKRNMNLISFLIKTQIKSNDENTQLRARVYGFGLNMRQKSKELSCYSSGDEK
jgi:hypothetical protein